MGRQREPGVDAAGEYLIECKSMRASASRRRHGVLDVISRRDAYGG